MTIEKIGEYIIENYPGTFTARSIMRGEARISADTCIDFFRCEKLKWCDCGSPENALEVVGDYLRFCNFVFEEKKNSEMTFASRFFDSERHYENPLLMCLAYSLDAVGLTEHGTSIFSAWLTEEGRMLLFLIDHEERTEKGDDE